MSAFRLRAQAIHKRAFHSLLVSYRPLAHTQPSVSRIYQAVARRGAKQTRVSVLGSTGASPEQSRGRSAPVLTFFPIFAPRTVLCGYAPFYDERGSRRAVNNKILAGAFEFQSPWWDDISDEAKLLIRKLLVLDPQLRPSAEKVFEDPWLRDPTCVVVGGPAAYSACRGVV